MDIAHDTAYQALLARDARFDGRLFVGVTSTGVYCRPICRVRTPKSSNCRFFETPAQAEAADFRPCMKCRPEISPGPGLPWSVMDASRTLARQAAQWLDAQIGEDDAVSIAQLAERLGVSDRHLRRIFLAEHGVTPVQHLQTRRLLLAKQLLTDTAMSMTQVALASGFGSLRRFNAAFAARYRIAPSRLRKEATDDKAPPDRITVQLGYREPCDIPRLMRFLAQRAVPAVEDVQPLCIRRTVRAGVIAAEAGWIEARFEPERSRVHLAFSPTWAPASARVVAAVRRWLDLDASPEAIDVLLAHLPGEAGLRLPGSVDPFELAVRAVLGQQVTVAAARTLARRVVERFGVPVETPWPDEITHAFPSPERLAACEISDIAELGIIRSRVGAIQALARGWATLVPSLQGRQPPEALIAALVALPGIGPWTAHYIAMRALSWPDAFPPNDVAVLKAMKQLFDIPSQREADVHAQAFQPWRSYAVLRLWDSLEKTS